MWFAKPITGSTLPARKLCLTFDDGPGRPQTDGRGPRTVELAHYLAEEQVRATFFAVGKHVRDFPEAIPQLQKLGHRIGNHGYHHRHMTGSFLPVSELTADVMEADAAIREAGASNEPFFFRPPYGAWSPRLAYFLNQDTRTARGFVGPVNWDLGGADFEFWLGGKSAEACATYYEKLITRKANHGAIVLMHDRSADSALANRNNKVFETVRILLPRLKNQGFSFCDLSEVPLVRQLQENSGW